MAPLGELPHSYGPQVHLLADPVLLSEVAELSRPRCTPPQMTDLLRDVYRHLVRLVAAAVLPTEEVSVDTRMRAQTEAGVWRGPLLRADSRVVVVDIARAGTVPAQVAFDQLGRWLDPSALRQDHLVVRRIHTPAGIDAAVEASKIGGPVAGAQLWFPDPMGATGASLRQALACYRALSPVGPARLVALHLIVSPEYVRTMARLCPELQIFAVRLDRGLSSPRALASPLGAYPDEERGLDGHHYIVPGAGDLGERLNNCAV